VAFDGWIRDRILDRDYEALFRYAHLAPYARVAVPTSEHFDPLFAALGAAGESRAEWIYEGFQLSHFSLRSVALCGE
jgi:4,5-DOPA dioxygenase extradiol